MAEPGAPRPRAASSSRSTRELEALGHEVEVASISRRGGSPTKYARLWPAGASRAAASASGPTSSSPTSSSRPGPPGRSRARARGRPLVVMAHGQDVANLGRIRGVTAATRWVVGRSAAVIANSRWLAGQLDRADPGGRGRRSRSPTCGVDLEAFSPRPAGRGPPRARLGRRGPGLPLRRLADRAQERRPPRRRLRALGPRPPRLRRRRAAARRSSRGGPACTLVGPRPAGRGAALDRRLRRPLPALADRALRPGDARGDGDGAHGRRHQRRRPAGVRHPGGRRPRRPAGPGRPAACPGAGGRQAHAESRQRARPPQSTT